MKNVINNKDNSYVKMPIVCASSGEYQGYEVLLRKFRGISLEIFNRNPELYSELTLPMLEHIFLLDSSGLIRKPEQSLYINMTASQLLSEGALAFLSQLHHQQLSSKKDQSNQYRINDVVIELTEQELDCDRSRLFERLLLFIRLGFKFGVDDFGVKASNFQRVFELETDVIKLDRGIIVRYSASKANKETLKYLINFCHNLNKQVIVEGVETKQQYQIAKECKANYLQGYYFGLPEQVIA